MKMQRKHLPLLAFLTLLITATPFESGLRIQNSRWNTQLSTTSILEMIIWILIVFISFLYWIHSKKSTEVNLKLFLIHFALTIPIVIWARLNLHIRQTVAENSNDIYEFISIINTILYSLFAMYCIGQIIFILLIFKIRNVKTEGYN